SLVIPDEAALIDLLVVRDPTVLQFPPCHGFEITVREVLVDTGLPPVMSDGGNALYLPNEDHAEAARLFDAPVSWVARDPAILEALVVYGDDISLNRGIVLPTIGMGPWVKTAEQIWHSDDHVDVRILGNADRKLEKYGESEHSHRWVVFDEVAIRPEAFMQSLDFFAYYPDRNWPQAYSREALEAAASGAVVI